MKVETANYKEVIIQEREKANVTVETVSLYFHEEIQQQEITVTGTSEQSSEGRLSSERISPNEDIEFSLANKKEVKDNKLLSTAKVEVIKTQNNKSSTRQKIPTLSDELKKKKETLQQDKTKELEVENLSARLKKDTQSPNIPVTATSDEQVETSFQKDKSKSLQYIIFVDDNTKTISRRLNASPQPLEKNQTKYF